jgi:SAM-dependent methyltransferase
MELLRDLAAAPRRSRLEARLLRRAADAEPPAVVDFKRERIGALRGTVVELGPGPGVNVPLYAPGVRLVAVEPNPAMHPGLREAAAAHGVELELLAVHAELLSLPDASADAVVATLVLCGVDDPAAVLAQARRVLRPGGTYVGYEHVRASEGSPTRLAQRLVKRPHRWLLNGCEVDRDTGALVRAAFPDAQVEPVDGGWPTAWTRPRILVTARR